MPTGSSHRDYPTDATRPRRSRDPARRAYYAHWRAIRFARRLASLASRPSPTPA